MFVSDVSDFWLVGKVKPDIFIVNEEVQPILLLYYKTSIFFDLDWHVIMMKYFKNIDRKILSCPYMVIFTVA